MQAHFKLLNGDNVRLRKSARWMWLLSPRDRALHRRTRADRLPRKNVTLSGPHGPARLSRKPGQGVDLVTMSACVKPRKVVKAICMGA